MQPIYAKAAIRDLEVRAEASQLNIRYAYPMETSYFSSGVNIERSKDVVRVVIARCELNQPCEPDIPVSLPRPANFEASVSIPWNGERVILVYTDGEEQISP